MSSLFRIEKPGLFTTVQDAGRPGYRGLGVPVAGAADRRSLALANALAGNLEGTAALELTRLGPTILALGPIYVALAGAPIEARLEFASGQTRKLPPSGATPLRTGDRLITGTISSGSRTYLAIHGGIESPLILGSRSSELALTAGSEFSSRPAIGPVLHLDPERGHQPFADPPEIRFISGPDHRAVQHPPLDQQILTIGREWGRIGISLERVGDLDQGHYPIEPNRTSAPVAPGSIQWTGSRWLLLGVAGGTMGGYPHVGQVLRTDLGHLAQHPPGQRIRLVRTTVENARAIDHDNRTRVLQRCMIIRTKSLSEIRLTEVPERHS